MPLLMLTQWTACNKYVALCHCVHGLPAHSMCSGQLVCSTITLGGPLLAMQPFIDADAECAGQGVDVRKTGVPASFVAALLQSEDAAGRLVAAACGGTSTGAGAGGGAGSGSGDANLGPLVTLVRAGREHCVWLMAAALPNGWRNGAGGGTDSHNAAVASVVHQASSPMGARPDAAAACGCLPLVRWFPARPHSMAPLFGVYVRASFVVCYKVPSMPVARSL